jgi:hypothetical protein
MISWRYVVPAVLAAAAVAACLTYFVAPSPPAEADRQLALTPPDMKGPDMRTRTNIDQRPNAEEQAKVAFERAAAAILRQAPNLQASAPANTNAHPSAEHIPLPKRRPIPRP